LQGEFEMPIYTYRCENCGVQFERHQSFTDEPLKRCPECSKNKLRKVITPAGIVFKGSGWYVTDNKAKSATASVPAAAKGDAKAEGKSEAKSESKDAPAPVSSSASTSDTSSKSDAGGSKSSSSE
jgi:putative FmdB family regulatory protein